MRGRGIRLSARHERWIHALLLLVYVTGIAWIVLHYGVNHGDGLENGWRIIETWMLRAHGATAMAALVALGSVLPVHVAIAWERHRNFISGASMLATLLLLAVSGWLLYYASGESARLWSSYVHMAIGISGPGALLWHLAYRKRIARPRAAPVTGESLVAPHAKNLLPRPIGDEPALRLHGE